MRGQFGVLYSWDTVGVEAPLVRQKLYLPDRRIKNVFCLIVVRCHSDCEIEAVVGAESIRPCIIHLLIDRRKYVLVLRAYQHVYPAERVRQEKED